MSAALVLVFRILLAASLYVFLGWAILILWRDLQRQSLTLGKRKIPGIQLAWQVDQQDQTRLFSTPEVTIGRDPSSDCPLPDDTISARHARLTYHHNQWWLEDLQSTNGTFLNQERLDVPTVIVSGDELRCGTVNVSIHIHER
jgi:pSer/pThr/pTyr-binding forkhead associated (FHA) protein